MTEVIYFVPYRGWPSLAPPSSAFWLFTSNVWSFHTSPRCQCAMLCRPVDGGRCRYSLMFLITSPPLQYHLPFCLPEAFFSTLIAPRSISLPSFPRPPTSLAAVVLLNIILCRLSISGIASRRYSGDWKSMLLEEAAFIAVSPF